MKRILALVLSLAMLLSLSVVVTATEDTPTVMDSTVQVKEYIGNLNVGKFNDIWGGITTNIVTLVTPGNSVTGLYYEKMYTKYNEEGGYYEVVEKVANHRSYTKTVEEGYLGIIFNYAPLTTAGSAIAKENWAVWQHIRVGDRLYLKNIDLELKNLQTSGVWGSSSYKSDSYIEVETVRDVYPTVTPYSNRSIVAQGDSITVGGGWTSVWSDYLSTTVINAGFGGDTSWASLANRYETYVASHNPEIVIVSFGINDAFNDAPSTALMEKYKTALRSIYAKNTELGAKTIFMTANVIKIDAIKDGGVFDKGDYSSFGGEEAYLDQFIDCMRQVAAEYFVPVIDLYSMWKAESLSPDNIIDSCHPNGHGYDMNWTVQRPALLENMKYLCGDDIRVLYGTTAKQAIDGMTDCTVTVKDAEGNAVANDALLLDGYTVSYASIPEEGEEAVDYGTYTVKTFWADKAYIKEDAPFSVRDSAIYFTDTITVSSVKGSILNPFVVVTDDGDILDDSADIFVGDVVTVKDDNENTVATYTVADGTVVDEGPSEDDEDPYEGCELGENLLLNRPYSATYNAFSGALTDNNNTLLTDGRYRGDGNVSWNGDTGVPFTTVEYAGTSAITSIQFDFDAPTDIHLITVKNVRIASNRGFLMDSVGVSTDGENFTNVAYKFTEVLVEGAPGYGTSGTPQYYDVQIRADVKDATSLKLSFGTGGAYIVQVDEIEAAAYIVEDDDSSSEEPSSEEPSSEETTEEPSEVEPSEEPSEDISSEETTDDASSEDSSDDETSDDTADAVYGDVNGDGAINSLDAAQSLKHDAKLITLEDAALAVADVNGDGTVNSLDAAQILKYDAKLIDSFAVEAAE
ncbi:MAG: hypothetical protein E7597_03155 [Ruminococcaceae bacterium]|nr:hypothetical protein [Oscillospiraceae bacterium]